MRQVRHDAGPICRMCARGDCPKCTRRHRDLHMHMSLIIPDSRAEQWQLCPHCDGPIHDEPLEAT
jgi:hypothetical protein